MFKRKPKKRKDSFWYGVGDFIMGILELIGNIIIAIFKGLD